jgi:hypothetical protein
LNEFFLCYTLKATKQECPEIAVPCRRRGDSMLDLDGFVVSIEAPEPKRVKSSEFYVQGWCFSKQGFENVKISIKAKAVWAPAFANLGGST